MTTLTTPQELNFITNHGRVLMHIAHDPDARLRDIGGYLGITERRAYDIVNDLVNGGYVVKTKVGRRNRYQIQDHLPIPDALEQGRAIRDLLRLLLGQPGSPAY